MIGYLRRAGGFDEPQLGLRKPAGSGYCGDPLYDVTVARATPDHTPLVGGTESASAE